MIGDKLFMEKHPTNAEQSFIIEAAHFLEHPNLLIRLANLVGQPIDILQKSLPFKLKQQLSYLIDQSLRGAMRLAVRSIQIRQPAVLSWDKAYQQTDRSFWAHTMATATTGAIGGWMGLAALPLELPVSTGLILRSISSVASEWGHNVQDPQIQMECLFIFTLGSSKSHSDDEMDEAYLTSRIAFAQMLRDAAIFISHHSSKQILSAIDKESAPIIVGLLSKIARSFEISVSRKIMTTAIPVIGAVTGAAINAAFCDYFTIAARYHFGLKYLENHYGQSIIQNLYQQAARGQLTLLDGAS